MSLHLPADVSLEKHNEKLPGFLRITVEPSQLLAEYFTVAGPPDQLQPPTGFDALRTIAVSRIYLDNFDHITAYWVGMGLNAADAAGTTPLMCAAFHGHTPVVRALLAAGASPLARQEKRRGRRAHTAREHAESKIEFWREAVCDKNRDRAEQRLYCYEEIRGMLLESERGVVAS